MKKVIVLGLLLLLFNFLFAALRSECDVDLCVDYSSDLERKELEEQAWNELFKDTMWKSKFAKDIICSKLRPMIDSHGDAYTTLKPVEQAALINFFAQEAVGNLGFLDPDLFEFRIKSVIPGIENAEVGAWSVARQTWGKTDAYQGRQDAIRLLH